MNDKILTIALTTILILIYLLVNKLYFKKQLIVNKYEETIDHKIPEELIKNYVLQSLKDSNFSKISEKKGSYIGYAKISPLSWGEQIEIIILKEKIKFISRSLLPTTLIDYNKNQSNSNLFFKNFFKIINTK